MALKRFPHRYSLSCLDFTLPQLVQDREYLPYKWQHYAPSTALLLSLLIVVKEDGELRFSFQYFKHLSFATVCGSRGRMAGNEW